MPNFVFYVKGYLWTCVGRNHQIWRALGLPRIGTGACLTSYKQAPPYLVHHTEFDRCWPNGTSVRMEIRLKNGPCLSRLLKVIGTDSVRAGTYDFLLTLYSDHGL